MSKWGQQNFPTSLVELSLNGENPGVVSFAVADDVSETTTPPSSFFLPPSLVSLELNGFMDVESLSEGSYYNLQPIKFENIDVGVEKVNAEYS
ncbi:hypothetical protein L1887_18141 [Cichorium endivia]|nr:hypothetical protein L1887_18141 [Cichorium endivia]